MLERPAPDAVGHELGEQHGEHGAARSSATAAATRSRVQRVEDLQARVVRGWALPAPPARTSGATSGASSRDRRPSPAGRRPSVAAEGGSGICDASTSTLRSALGVVQEREVKTQVLAQPPRRAARTPARAPRCPRAAGRTERRGLAQEDGAVATCSARVERRGDFDHTARGSKRFSGANSWPPKYSRSQYTA